MAKVLQTLYSVTTVEGDGDTRTPVICTSLERAKDIIENNEGDIFETSNRYAVIESLYADVLYPQSVTAGYVQIWYRWEGTYEEGRYVPCEVPERYRHTVGFGIG